LLSLVAIAVAREWFRWVLKASYAPVGGCQLCVWRHRAGGGGKSESRRPKAEGDGWAKGRMALTFARGFG
jgi:hypothetical protein